MAHQEFPKNREDVNKELTRFVEMLNELLPKYAQLLKKVNLSAEEIEELQQTECFLSEINDKISKIKTMLENDLVGHSLDHYYQLKKMAAKGDVEAKSKLDNMHDLFAESLKGNTIVNWN